jgi:hypothetical protein
MFGSNSNFIETKDLALAIVTERDAITFTLVLSKDVNILLSRSYNLCIYHRAPNLYHRRSKPTK